MQCLDTKLGTKVFQKLFNKQNMANLPADTKVDEPHFAQSCSMLCFSFPANALDLTKRFCFLL